MYAFILVIIFIILIAFIHRRYKIYKSKSAQSFKDNNFFNKYVKESIAVIIICVVVAIVIWGIGRIYADKDADNTYQADLIYVWTDELYSKRIDPAAFEKVETISDEQAENEVLTSNPDDIMSTDGDAIPDENDYAAENMASAGQQSMGEEYTTEDTEKQPLEVNITAEEVSNKFQMLHIWGLCKFNGNISLEDIKYVNEQLEGFLNSDESIEIIKEYYTTIPEEERHSYNKRIADFERTYTSNNASLTPSDYFQNCNDRLCKYWDNNSNRQLEQAAIATESAVEMQSRMQSLEEYETWFLYIRVAIAEFCHVLSIDSSGNYDSGSYADVLYRIGKLLYKPAANLHTFTADDKCYSLCSAYVVLKKAYDAKDDLKTYRIETAYYFLQVSEDMVKYMDIDEAQDICRDAVGAYQFFLDEGEKNPENVTYINYSDEATASYNAILNLLKLNEED